MTARKKATRKKSAPKKAKILSFLEGKVAISTKGELDVSETENRVVHVPELDDFFIVQGGGGTAWWSVELDHSATLEEVISPHWDPKKSDGAGEVGSRNVAKLPGVEVHEWIEGEAYNSGDVIWDESGYEDPEKLKGKVKYLATALGEDSADVLAWEFSELEDRVLDWVRELVDTEETEIPPSAGKLYEDFRDWYLRAQGTPFEEGSDPSDTELHVYGRLIANGMRELQFSVKLIDEPEAEEKAFGDVDELCAYLPVLYKELGGH